MEQHISPPHTHTPGMVHWRFEAWRAFSSWLEQSNLKSYVWALKHFEAFRAQERYMQMWSFPLEQFLQYGVFLMKGSLAVCSIRGCFCALAFIRKALGYKDRPGGVACMC